MHEAAAAEQQHAFARERPQRRAERGTVALALRHEQLPQVLLVEAPQHARAGLEQRRHLLDLCVRRRARVEGVLAHDRRETRAERLALRVRVRGRKRREQPFHVAHGCHGVALDRRADRLRTTLRVEALRHLLHLDLDLVGRTARVADRALARRTLRARDLVHCGLQPDQPLHVRLILLHDEPVGHTGRDHRVHGLERARQRDRVHVRVLRCQRE